MESLQLDRDELRSVADLVQRITDRISSAEDPELLLEAPVLAQELPIRVHRFLNSFRREEWGCCAIAGHAVNDEDIGVTPEHWGHRPSPSTTLSHEVLLVLYSSVLGDVFGWSTQQDGRLLHDVFPVRGHEQEQLSSGSETLLTWHTEDAFHPYRCDYVVLACLRNPYRAITTVGNADELELAPEDVEVLFQERFIIRPDESHLPKNNTRDGVDFSRIKDLANAPRPKAVLFGARDRPYIRADPYFMDVEDGDEQARRALDALITAVDLKLRDVVLQPGDYCFLDNYKVVHGRRPFKARYNGSDRWLKRACITRDLRKSRDARSDVVSQVVA